MRTSSFDVHRENCPKTPIGIVVGTTANPLIHPSRSRHKYIGERTLQRAPTTESCSYNVKG